MASLSGSVVAVGDVGAVVVSASASSGHATAGRPVKAVPRVAKVELPVVTSPAMPVVTSPVTTAVPTSTSELDVPARAPD